MDVDWPVIKEEELRLHAEHVMQASDLSGYNYAEVVRILTVASYVEDLCIVIADLKLVKNRRFGIHHQSSDDTGSGQWRPTPPALLPEAPSFVRPAPRASSVPTTKIAAARAQGLSRLAALCAAIRKGLALIGPSTAASLVGGKRACRLVEL